jgi:hypothetical protein
MPNVIVLDATVVDASGVVVPRDIDDADLDSVPQGYDFSTIDAYELSRAVKSDWVVKVTNDADNDVDVTPGVTTAGDGAFDDWTGDGNAETAPSGSVPDNIVHITGETVAGHIGVELVADPAPTSGTLTIEFGSRRYGGA